LKTGKPCASISAWTHSPIFTGPYRVLRKLEAFSDLATPRLPDWDFSAMIGDPTGVSEPVALRVEQVDANAIHCKGTDSIFAGR